MSHHLRVNPITCQAHGMCAELLPERISLDDILFRTGAGKVGAELSEGAGGAINTRATKTTGIARRSMRYFHSSEPPNALRIRCLKNS